MNLVKRYVGRLKTEFSGYNGKKFGKDLLAGVTVAAVALPLALAFGVSSGADAAAGLVTALLAGIIMGVFSGASYQISGPTGAMSAILISLVAQYGLNGVFIACFISGAILLLCGIFKLGGIVSFIPTPVITGFTSGIAIIIAFGQINNLTGFTSAGESTIDKFVSYFQLEQHFNPTAFIIGAAVILFMFIYPKKWNGVVPSSLVAIILATAANFIFKFDCSVVGEIPKTLFLENRLDLSQADWAHINNLILPAVSIAALGLIESLLCGASAGRMKNEKLDSDQELIAQGLGNMIIPFFGGVPATAAIARTSVAIKAGGQTRVVSIIHSVVLLLSMFLLGGVMSEIPLAALAGVLIVTAVRMNEFAVIKDIFGRKIKTAMFQFLITMLATVIFDLTIAILIGVKVVGGRGDILGALFSVIMFVLKVSEMTVNITGVHTENMTADGAAMKRLEATRVAYITGPLYFGTASKLSQKLEDVITDNEEYVIFSLRGMPIADLSGVNAFAELCDKLLAQGKKIYFSCVQPPVAEMFARCGLEEKIGKENFFWSTDKVLEFMMKTEDSAAAVK